MLRNCVKCLGGQHGISPGKVELMSWMVRYMGSNHFGNVSKKVKLKEAEIKMLNEGERTRELVENIKKAERELDELLACEETWWAQRFRATWLAHGDKNMKVFHQKASQRRDRDWVNSIQDDNGVWYHEEEDIAKVITNFIQDLFEANELAGTEEVVQVVKNRINEDMKKILEPRFTVEEVFEALKQVHHKSTRTRRTLSTI